MRVSWAIRATLLVFPATTGCGKVAPEARVDAATTDGGAPDVLAESEAEGSPDGTTDAQDAAPDALSDANACMPDSTEVVCCCDGDLGGQLVCLADGTLGCSAGTTLYFGADCMRPCGPCMLPCRD